MPLLDHQTQVHSVYTVCSVVECHLYCYSYRQSGIVLCKLVCHSIITAADSAVSPHGCLWSPGFTVIQWWSAVGLVACYWSTGEDKAAEDYYACIDGLSGDR